ncbi:MAG: UbiD family decarboxylase [Chloroflexota bacterium]|nr:UbiD family decarboxylase [Chloroflexota bacterium]
MEQVDALGQLRKVRNATWQEDIGMISEVVGHTRGSPAVLVDEIPGHAPGYRVLVNSFHSLERIKLTLGLPVDADVWSALRLWRARIGAARPIEPMPVEEGPVLENVLMGDDVDVLKFPTPIWHESDGGRYLGTASADITRDPETGWVNLGTYRVMVHDKNRVGFYISPGKHGRIHREKYFAKGEPCPLAIAIGLNPLLFLASCTEVPPNVSEYAWAGGMRGEPLRVVEGRVTGLPIPADAEIVLEGFAYPNDTVMEGPFGEWTGYYASASREEPVLHVKAIYHRNNPIIVGSPPNRPPDEQSHYRAFMRSALVWEEIEKAGVPDVTGVWCHEAGGSRLFVAVSIKQRYFGHSRQAMHIAAMCHTGAYLGRYVVVVDDDIDVTDLEQVVWAICTRSDPERSIDFIKRAWSGPLDSAIRPEEKGYNSRALIDATRPWEWRDRFPAVSAPSPQVAKKAREKWGWLVKGEK